MTINFVLSTFENKNFNSMFNCFYRESICVNVELLPFEQVSRLRFMKKAMKFDEFIPQDQFCMWLITVDDSITRILQRTTDGLDMEETEHRSDFYPNIGIFLDLQCA